MIKKIIRAYENMKNWLTEKPRYRDHRQEERQEEQRAYDEVLDKFRREHPEGLRLGRKQDERITREGCYDDS